MKFKKHNESFLTLESSGWCGGIHYASDDGYICYAPNNTGLYYKF